MRSRDTTVFALSSSSASRARCFGAPSGSGPSSPTASTDPRMRNSIVTNPLPSAPQAEIKRPPRWCSYLETPGRSIHMIHAGDTIHNPVTGERIVFRQTSRETNGQAVVIETFVQPNGFVAAAHVHPSQEERFEILRGSVGFQIGRKKLVAGPGQRLTVPAGTPHKFW